MNGANYGVRCVASGLRVTADDMKTTSPVRTGQKNCRRVKQQLLRDSKIEAQNSQWMHIARTDVIANSAESKSKALQHTCIWSIDAVTTTRPHMRVHD
jgi:hypothetical protein